jgi:cytochrome c553
MNDYKTGKRDNAMMKGQAANLTPDDYANLAAYYAALK